MIAEGFITDYDLKLSPVTCYNGGPTGAPQPSQSYHLWLRGLSSGHRANWSCSIRGGEAQGIYHRCSALSIRSLSLSPYLKGFQTDDSPLRACP